VNILKQKKIPLRKCISCGENKSKKELLRIVKTNENKVLVDLTGKINGRGAYICSSISCFELAHKNKKISRALKMEIDDELYESLKENIKEDSES
jgi:predicted RNA-binding protein YlxR (DUF448 family)